MANVPLDHLRELNVNIAYWEQQRDTPSITNLERALSSSLMFRRADGSVVGKAEFMEGLRKPSPFVARESTDIAATILGNRALVTLYVNVTKADGSTGRDPNMRLFIGHDTDWQLEFWFNDDVSKPL